MTRHFDLDHESITEQIHEFYRASMAETDVGSPNERPKAKPPVCRAMAIDEQCCGPEHPNVAMRQDNAIAGPCHAIRQRGSRASGFRMRQSVQTVQERFGSNGS